MKKTRFFFVLPLFICSLVLGISLGSCSPSIANRPVYEGMSINDEYSEMTTSNKRLKVSNLNAGENNEEFTAETKIPFYLCVHIKNPQAYEILSFTLNETKYQSFQFEDGSDSETLILEMNPVLEESELVYTIDAIKFVIDTEIENVDMSVGNKTISVTFFRHERIILEELRNDKVVRELRYDRENSLNFSLAETGCVADQSIFTIRKYNDIGYVSTTYAQYFVIEKINEDKLKTINNCVLSTDGTFSVLSEDFKNIIKQGTIQELQFYLKFKDTNEYVISGDDLEVFSLKFKLIDNKMPLFKNVLTGEYGLNEDALINYLNSIKNNPALLAVNLSIYFKQNYLIVDEVGDNAILVMELGYNSLHNRLVVLIAAFSSSTDANMYSSFQCWVDESSYDSGLLGWYNSDGEKMAVSMDWLGFYAELF